MGPINFDVQQGEILFIVGSNGSGKTTLLKLITGLYPPLKGIIQINSQPVNIAQFNYIFSAVFSDFHLFERLHHSPQIDSTNINKYLQMMSLDQKVSWKENKFSTIKLSSGEKRRLALVIALIEDKPVYIFDEFASDQDPKFTKYFYQTIIQDLKNDNKIVIVVTHDKRYFNCADKVLVLSS